mmetsp:Transcript_46791/g.100021  ORF Transcript_46791/g.100021 Transcript_46791/m.100021 type:complete len:237 (-) Transcript_46791:618-1328(-)
MSACLSSSSASDSTEPPCSLPVSAFRRLLSAASRCSLMKEKRSFNGNFPAVWFKTKFVFCVLSFVVGTFTPSIKRSPGGSGKTGALTSRGPRPCFSLRRAAADVMESWICCAVSASSSAPAVLSTSSRMMSGLHEPTTVTVTGSKSNCAMLNWSSVREVLCLVGRKVTTTFVVPSGGITPASGAIWKSGWASSTVISNSNWIGTVHESGITFVRDVPTATRPKSRIRGNFMSFAEG